MMHAIAVTLYKNGAQTSLVFELKHRNMIKKFGRFPHRNSILGRTSTQTTKL